jgi:Kef-type K+ transport system membrane component KefB
MKKVGKINNDTSSLFLIVFVVITVITNVSIAVIQSFVENWYRQPTITVVLLCLQILRTVSYILPAFAIKNRTYKIISTILISLVVVYLLFSPILALFQRAWTT